MRIQLLHIFMNMSTLVAVGTILEFSFGSLNLLFVTLWAVPLSSAIYIFLNWSDPMHTCMYVYIYVCIKCCPYPDILNGPLFLRNSSCVRFLK